MSSETHYTKFHEENKRYSSCDYPDIMCKTQLLSSPLAPHLRDPVPIHVPVVTDVTMLISGKVSLLLSRSDSVKAPGADRIVCSVAIPAVREPDQGFIRHDISFKGKKPLVFTGTEAIAVARRRRLFRQMKSIRIADG